MKIGYIQKRSSLMSEDDQAKELLKHGIEHVNLYTPDEGLNEAIKSCRKGDELVVWSAAVIGNHAYAKTIKALAAIGADLHVLRKGLDIPCKQSIPAADGLNDIKQASRMNGKKNGRKLSITPAQAKNIEAYVGEGNTQAQAAEHYGVSTRAVSWILNGTYFKPDVQGDEDVSNS